MFHLIDDFEKATSKLGLACQTSDVATDASDIEREKSRQRRYHVVNLLCIFD